MDVQHPNSSLCQSKSLEQVGILDRRLLTRHSRQATRSADERRPPLPLNTVFRAAIFPFTQTGILVGRCTRLSPCSTRTTRLLDIRWPGRGAASSSSPPTRSLRNEPNHSLSRLAAGSLLPVAAPAQARKTPLASKRPVIPDLLDDDDDNTFAAVSPPMLVSSGSGSVPRRSSSPICAVRIDEQDRQSGPVARQPTYEDDDEILICGVVTSTVQPAGGSSIVADEDELIEVVSSTLAPVPRPVRHNRIHELVMQASGSLEARTDCLQNARASSSRTPSVTAPAFPLDLQRSLAKQGRVLAGLSGRLSPASPLPCATVRVDSAVAGLWSSKGLSAAAAEPSDDENDPDHVHGMMVAGIEAATAFAETRRSISGITSARSSEARADGAGAKRKKYKLDSSDAEDDAAYLKARRAAAAVKSKLQPSPEPRHVKGKGKERSVGAEDSDESELRTVSAEPAPKRKRKTADEIVRFVTDVSHSTWLTPVRTFTTYCIGLSGFRCRGQSARTAGQGRRGSASEGTSVLGAAAHATRRCLN